MQFISYGFIFFLAVCFLVYYLIPKRYQWGLLLVVSYFFYFQAGSFYPCFLLITSATVYFAAYRMGNLSRERDLWLKMQKGLSREERKKYKEKIQEKRKFWMFFCILLNFFILAVLKYANFAIDIVDSFLEITGSGQYIDSVRLLLPMGISFYTFQAIGYLLDVYWEKYIPQENFFRFSLFISFFPQLVQGPISRYQNMSKTLFEEHAFDWKKVRFGLERILWGYFKKLVVADRISIAVAMISSDPEYYCGAFVIANMLFYGIELYADFTGGIDIAIGIAQIFGVHLDENFERPYFSKNIAEYWRRWHISMGTWFKDYVFYPLSISRILRNITGFVKNYFGKACAKRIPVYFATIITWLATGIWHGASWNFIVWGLMNGLIILISQELHPLYDRFHRWFPGLVKSTVWTIVQVIRTFLLMSSLRLFDCYKDVKTVFQMFFSVFMKFDLSVLTVQEFKDMGLGRRDYLIVAASLVLIFVVSMLQRKQSVREQISALPYWIKYAIFIGLFFVTLLFGAYGNGYDASGFIYNQF